MLDVGLPDAHGFDWCRLLRRDFDVPVLFLTARASEVDRVAGLELGADDYVTKPFSPREVVARIRAILRRGRAPAAAPAAQPAARGANVAAAPAPAPAPETATPVPGAPAFAFAADRTRVTYRGQPLALTRQELALLQVFLERPGRIWSRDDLLSRAWPDPGSCTDRTVDAHVKLLRAKLRAITPDDDPIETHRGLGYALRRTP